MVRICNSFTYLDLYGSDEEILPAGYERTYTSGSYGMDNKFQVYRKGGLGVIHFRGSTDDRMSWLENINSAMIPAEGTMKVQGETFDYCFAKDEKAAVHTGYALGVAFLRQDLRFHIENLNQKGVHDIIITGHSQGGALTNMTLAYLNNLPEEELSPKNRFKAYSYAAPMVGNKAFAREYRYRYCVEEMSYNIVNPKDPIPRFPLSYHENKEEFVAENLKKFLSEDEELRMGDLLKEGAALVFEDELKQLVRNMDQKTNQEIERELGEIDLPSRVEGIDYHPLGNRERIAPAEYPKVLKDSTILENDSLMAEYERGPDGHFKDESLYEKESAWFHHKPYNYYLGFLKTYFPAEAKGLEPRK